MRKLRMSELNRMDVETFRTSKKIPVVIVLDRVRSLHNVGSIFRTADAFRMESIYLGGLTANPPHPEIDKTALGATESVPWEAFDHTTDALDQLRSKGYHIYGIEQTTERTWLDEFNLPTSMQGIGIVMGHEVNGVDTEILQQLDGCIEIPQIGTKHSLNVSVSAGIVMWELFKRLKGQL